MNKLLPTSTVLVAALLGSVARADEPTNPVAFTLSCTIPSGQLLCTAQAAPPAGKQIVLQNVSARVGAPSGQTAQLFVSLASMNMPSGSIAARHWVALTATSGGTSFATHPLRMVGLTDAPVSIQGQRLSYSSATGSVQFEVHFTAYLLP